MLRTLRSSVKSKFVNLMIDFNLKKHFNLVIIPFHAFQHVLRVEDQLSCLRCVHRHLAPNGFLILDVFNPNLSYLVEDKFLREWGEEAEFRMPDGRRVQRQFRTIERNLQLQLLQLEMIHYVTQPDGRRERYADRIAMRYFFRYELEHLISRAGFYVEAIYGDYQNHLFGDDASAEIVIAARKSDRTIF